MCWREAGQHDRLVQPERLALPGRERGVEPQALPAIRHHAEVFRDSGHLDQVIEGVHLPVREGGGAGGEGVERERAVAGGEVVPLPDEAEGDLAWPLREPGATAQADQAVATVPAMGAAHEALQQRVERGGLGRQRVAGQTRGSPVGVGEEGDVVEAGQLREVVQEALLRRGRAGANGMG